MSQELAQEMDKALRRMRKHNPYPVQVDAIVSMLSVAFVKRKPEDIINFLGGKHAVALFAESFDDAIYAQRDRFLLPGEMEAARDKLKKIAGVHANATGDYCTLPNGGSWAGMEGEKCPHCGCDNLGR